MKLLLIAAFLGCILAANYVTDIYGMVTVLGVGMTAGTFLAGATFVLRDSLQDAYGKRWTVALIVAGAALSFIVSAPFIALASGVAFLVAELADLAVYTPLRRQGYVRAAVASNVVGSLIDTVLFLWIAGFPVWVALPGQMFGKLLITLGVVGLVAMIRATRRHEVRFDGPLDPRFSAETGEIVGLAGPVRCRACGWTHTAAVDGPFALADAEQRMTELHNQARAVTA